MRDALVVACYLFAAVAANLVVSAFGPVALPFTAFALIPFDLFSRDVLHERWSGSRYMMLWMGALVASGSLLSFAVNRSALPVALASCISFAAAGATDTAVYSAAGRLPRPLKMNLSNLVSSSVDSVVFPLVAFGVLSAQLSTTQAATKFLGGVMWTALYVWFKRGRR